MFVTINGMRFKIRKYADDDYWFIYKLTKNNMSSLFLKHWGGWNPIVFRDHFNSQSITKIVEYKTKRIACCGLRIEDNFAYIDNIQVSTLVRRKGLGTILMKQMENETKKHKIKKIQIRVFKDSKAKDLYLNLGYKKAKDEKSAVILEKDL